MYDPIIEQTTILLYTIGYILKEYEATNSLREEQKQIQSRMDIVRALGDFTSPEWHTLTGLSHLLRKQEDKFQQSSQLYTHMNESLRTGVYMLTREESFMLQDGIHLLSSDALVGISPPFDAKTHPKKRKLVQFGFGEPLTEQDMTLYQAVLSVSPDLDFDMALVRCLVETLYDNKDKKTGSIATSKFAKKLIRKTFTAPRPLDTDIRASIYSGRMFLTYRELKHIIGFTLKMLGDTNFQELQSYFDANNMDLRTVLMPLHTGDRMPRKTIQYLQDLMQVSKEFDPDDIDDELWVNKHEDFDDLELFEEDPADNEWDPSIDELDEAEQNQFDPATEASTSYFDINSLPDAPTSQEHFLAPDGEVTYPILVEPILGINNQLFYSDDETTVRTYADVYLLCIIQGQSPTAAGKTLGIPTRVVVQSIQRIQQELQQSRDDWFF